MSVKELERLKEGDVTPVKKPERPKDWTIVMHYGAVNQMHCCVCLLTEVFNMNHGAAAQHVKNAHATGRDVVFKNSKDVVETKTTEALKARDMRSKTCTPQMSMVDFKAQPT